MWARVLFCFGGVLLKSTRRKLHVWKKGEEEGKRVCWKKNLPLNNSMGRRTGKVVEVLKSQQAKTMGGW